MPQENEAKPVDPSQQTGEEITAPSDEGADSQSATSPGQPGATDEGDGPNRYGEGTNLYGDGPNE